MCDEINEEHPRDHIPKRCRNYNKEAQKAFRKAEDEKQQSSEDLKFNGQVNGE